MPNPGDPRDGREAADESAADRESQPAALPRPQEAPAAADGGGTPPVPPSRPWLRLVALAGLIIVAAGLAFGVYLLVHDEGDDQAEGAAAVTMPSLVGLQE